MKIKNSTLIYDLLNELSEENLSEFKTYVFGKKDELNFIEAYEKNKDNVSDDIILNSTNNTSTENSFEIIKKNTQESLLNYIHLNHYAENSIEKLKKELELADIICSYGNKEIGLVKIQKIKDIAQSYNHFDVVSIALDYLLKYDDSYKLKPEKALEFAKEFDHNLELIVNKNTYAHLSLQIFSYQNILNVEPEVIQNFLNNPLLKDKSKTKSIIARYYYYMALMDSYSLTKNFKERFIVVNNAVAYFKGVLKTNNFFFSKYIFLLERKAHSALLLRDFEDLKKTINLIEQINIPTEYLNDHTFLFKIELIRLKYTCIYLANTDLDKAFDFLKTDFSNILNTKQASIGDLQQTYYTLIFHYAVKFQKHDEIIKLTPHFTAFFFENHKSLDPNRTNLLQIFICIFLAAYKALNLVEYKQFIKTVLTHPNASIQDKINIEFHYIDKLNKIILDAFANGFFSEDTFKKYVKLWSFKPGIHDKAICIAQNSLPKEYRIVRNQSWNDDFKKVCF